MSKFQIGDRVKDISGLLDGPAHATVKDVRESDYDQQPAQVKVKYDVDETNPTLDPNYEGSWWPETDFVRLPIDEDPKAPAEVGIPCQAELTNGEWFVQVGQKWPRQLLLEEATQLTCGDRNAQYGDPLQDFKRSAAILNALGYQNSLNGGVRQLTGHDVALIVAAVKMSRIAWAPSKRDSWVDLAGYAACGWENVEAQLREDPAY